MVGNPAELRRFRPTAAHDKNGTPGGPSFPTIVTKAPRSPAMPFRTTTTTTNVSRNLFPALALALVAGLLAAFWMLCSDQVRKAEARDAAARGQRIAVGDCLRDVPGATLSSCAARIASLDPHFAPAAAVHSGAPTNAAAPGLMSSRVPVNFVYR